MTKVINLRKRYKTNFKSVPKANIKKPKKSILGSELFKIIFTCISLVSILLGCIIYRYNPINEISTVCANFISNLQHSSYLQVFIYCLKFDLLYYLIMFFVGTSIIGIPLTICPLVLKCAFIGYLSSLMYCEYELKGILFCLVLLYPFFTVTTTSLIYAANESVYMCRYVFNAVTNKNTADNISVRLYLLRYIFLIGINTACVAVNSLLITVIANRFILQ